MSAIYIHIPYCKQKCGYCSFYSVTDFCTMDSYIDALCREIKSFGKEENSSSASVSSLKIDTVYIGGGTPSLLSVEQLEKIFTTLRNIFNIVNNSEITIEINPESVNLEFLSCANKLGVNRISIGLQSHDNKILKKINRLHTYSDFVNAINMMQKIGFTNVSADIIGGLPNQDIASAQKSLENLTKQEVVKHISFYSLTLDGDTQLYKTGTKVDADLQADIYDMAVDFLQRKGFNRYEISNFAKEGYASKHNQKYWTGENYYGFGAGAHSLINDVRIENLPNIKSYIEQDFSKKIHNCKVYNPLTQQEKIEELIIMSLRTASGINLKTLKENFDYDLLIKKKAQIDNLINNKLLIKNNNFLSIAPKSFYLMDAIALQLI